MLHRWKRWRRRTRMRTHRYTPQTSSQSSETPSVSPGSPQPELHLLDKMNTVCIKWKVQYCNNCTTLILLYSFPSVLIIVVPCYYLFIFVLFFSPVSGMPCARCMRELRTSLAETKNMWLGACSRSRTFNSSTRKLMQRSVCCFLTYREKWRLQYFPNNKLPFFLTRDRCRQSTHVVHVLWFICWGVPPVVEDEDVRLWQTFVHFVKKVLFLEGGRIKRER